MNTKQIAEELAEKWHFCAELEADVTAAIEKATEITDAANASLLALAAVVRGHPNTPESLKTIASKELLDSNRGSYLVNELQRLRKELRAAHGTSAVADASEPITELVEALRMLRDFQNGCPLPSYEKGWNEAIRLTDDALRKYEPQSAAHASEKRHHYRAEDAIGLIINERQRQIVEEGWSHSHDDGHTDGALSKAAACYAIGSSIDMSDFWPWDEDSFKLTPNNRIRELVKAGALICAEIDRLSRAAHASEKYKHDVRESHGAQ